MSLAGAILAFAFAFGGCGGDPEPSGAELADAFAAAAAADRESSGEDGGSGTCFALDEKGVEALLNSLGEEAPPDSASYGFIQGAGKEDEDLSCGIAATFGDKGAESGAASVFVGLAGSEDAEGFLERKLDEDASETFRGHAPGLEDDDIGGWITGTTAAYVWVDDGVRVALAVEADRDRQEGFDALSVLVPEVARTLGAD